jgi:hypothetical protein
MLKNRKWDGCQDSLPHITANVTSGTMRTVSHFALFPPFIFCGGNYYANQEDVWRTARMHENNVNSKMIHN